MEIVKCEQLGFLNEKISWIDGSIGTKDFNEALLFIDDVLEYVPGWEIEGKVAKTGEIYWKKLLAKTRCANGVELASGDLEHFLDEYAEYKNAVKYANGDEERNKYESIKTARETIAKRLEEALAQKELDAKRKTDVEKKLTEYKEEYDRLRKVALENIARLEDKEREIREQTIDCEAVIGEHNFAFEDLWAKVWKMSDNRKDEITNEELNVLKAQLDIICEESELEFTELQQRFSTQEKFVAYNGLIEEQKAICEEIDKNRRDLVTLNSKVFELADTIENITKEYATARERLSDGDFNRAKALLPAESFEEIVEQTMSDVKGEE